MKPNYTLTPENALSSVDWDDVLDTLAAKKCVLFLGSGILEAPGGENFENALEDWLDASNPNHPHIQVFNPDGFYLFKKNRFRRKIVSSMKEFYNQPFPETETLFSQVAQIPFPVIFSLTPDNILARTFDGLGLDYEPDFYFRNRKASDLFNNPTIDKPIIYNILGNIEEPESIILTHRDFFDYLSSVFQGNSMNGDFKDYMEGMERYIFLGVPYEKWYFQLILRILSLHSEKLGDIERLAMREFENSNLHTLYTQEFKLDFFPAEPIEFIKTLHAKCKERNLLKSLPLLDVSEENSTDPSLGNIQELIATAKMAEAMKLLKSFLKRRKPATYNLMNDLIVLSNRYYLLKQREQRGTIDSRDLSVESAQITESLLQLTLNSRKYK